APATAGAIARLALGLADDYLGAVALATAAPLVVAPAMEHHMLHHPAVRDHLATLERRGATIVPPGHGRLASGAIGDGRLAPTEAIVGAIRATLGRQGSLAGRTVVVTAGGTHEPIDPVRFVGNRSSGQMGYALAEEARDRGASVILVSGPTALADPFGIDVRRVETAEQMLQAVAAATAAADALVMAAAVADFRPETAAEQKLKKLPGETTRSLVLVRNPDILASVVRDGLITVGFAAETEDLEANAAAKLRAKSLAMIVANEATATIGAPTSRAVILWPDRAPERLPPMPKEALAAIVVDRLHALLAAESERDA
ncbi:MAG TPA: bifunctional phosphopantothenoylcysteine decarboxylase/phosphopantothenate--cysteine ligase CoaBC, partial [Thermomicrobiales bacterium]|nr:bifunctional phosphopantothenoylcysteine decarboxylase/phosphopantothenate--cysteine ligase CoaBC [Thermomicrobiales bacterium]